MQGSPSVVHQYINHNYNSNAQSCKVTHDDEVICDDDDGDGDGDVITTSLSIGADGHDYNRDHDD